MYVGVRYRCAGIHEKLAGSGLEYVENDGSTEWDELQKRAQEGPVFSGQ